MSDTRGTFKLKNVRNDILSNEYVPVPAVFIDNSTSQSTTAGYYIGGSTNSPYVAMSNIDKLTYANDTISTPPNASGFGRYTAPAPYNYYDNITVSNNGAFALFTNWHICNTPSPAPVMYKHDFSTDDVTTVPSLAPVFPGAGGNGGAGTAETAWWHASTGSSGSYDAIKITYATESYSVLPSGTGFSSNGLGSFSRIFQNQLVAGWTPASPSSNPGASQCKKLTFATDTFTDNGWTLNSNRSSLAAVDAGSDDNTGLVAGGYLSPGLTNTVEKITLSSSTTSSAPTMPGSRYRGAGHSSGSGGSGYFSAQSSGAGATTAISKVPFSSYGGWGAIPATLSVVRRNCVGYSGLSKALKSGMPAPIERWFDGSPENLKAYLIAGSTPSSPGGQSGTQKFNYTTETASTLSNGSLPTDVSYYGQNAAATGNSTDGIHAGGWSSRTSKLSYSSDTWTVTGNLPSGGGGFTNSGSDYRYQQGHTSPSAAYASGGNYNYIGSETFKMPYSTDVWERLPATQLTRKRDQLHGTGMSITNCGYILGGGDPSSESYGSTNADKITYATDTTSLAPAGMTAVSGTKYSSAAVGLADLGGYWVDGTPSNQYGIQSQCCKIHFNSESYSYMPNLYWNMRAVRRSATGGGNHVYFSGGNYMYNGENGVAPWSIQSTVLKINASTDSMSVLTNTGMVPVDRHRSFSPAANNFSIQSSKVNTSGNSTVTSTRSGMPVLTPSLPNTSYVTANSDSPNRIFRKLNMSNETISNVPGNVLNTGPSPSTVVFGHVATSSQTAGYFSGGEYYWGPGARFTATEKMTYSNDSHSRIPGANMIREQSFASTTGNSEFGVGIGGERADAYPSDYNHESRIQKITYSTETFANVTQTLNNARRWSTALTEQTKGAYVVSGSVVGSGPANSTWYSPGNVSFVEKYTFATDSVARLPEASYFRYSGGYPEWGGRGAAMGAGTKTDGYFAGGAGPSDPGIPTPGTRHTTIDRLSYSTSTWSQLGTFLSGGKYQAFAMQNTTDAYFCGGYGNPGSNGTTTEKLTFATDSCARVPGTDWPWINGAGFGPIVTAGARQNSAYGSVPNVI